MLVCKAEAYRKAAILMNMNRIDQLGNNSTVQALNIPMF